MSAEIDRKQLDDLLYNARFRTLPELLQEAYDLGFEETAGSEACNQKLSRIRDKLTSELKLFFDTPKDKHEEYMDIAEACQDFVEKVLDRVETLFEEDE